MKIFIIFFGFIFSLYVLAQNPLESGETFIIKNFNKLKNSSDNFCRKKVWVRNFNKEENGGGHQWRSLKTQRIEKSGFNCYNWRQCIKGRDCNDPQFSCSQSERPDDPSCLAQSLTPEKSLYILKWMANLEITGVPEASNPEEGNSELFCSVDPQDQSLPGTKPMDLNLKTVFSPDTYTCCLGVGKEVPEDGTADDCCSGYINQKRCALPDYTNVSVYFNVYVSTEAHDLKPGLVDEKTGYIKNPYLLERVACVQRACASNKLARGVAISNLKVPGLEDFLINVRRFVVNDSEISITNRDIASLYDAGLRWNNQVYCVPKNLVSYIVTGLSVIDCSIFQ